MGHRRGRFEVPVFASPHLDPWHPVIACQQPWTDPLEDLRHMVRRARSVIAQADHNTRRLAQAVLRDGEDNGAHQEPS